MCRGTTSEAITRCTIVLITVSTEYEGLNNKNQGDRQRVQSDRRVGRILRERFKTLGHKAYWVELEVVVDGRGKTWHIAVRQAAKNSKCLVKIMD